MPSEKYEYGVDFERVAAIDIHTHVEVDGHGHKAYDDELVDAVGKYFKRGPGELSSVDGLADEYRRHNTAAVVFTIDARTGARHEPNSIEDLIVGAIRNNDVLIPFGSVDPWHERRAVHQLACQPPVALRHPLEAAIEALPGDAERPGPAVAARLALVRLQQHGRERRRQGE